ncbi:MORN repeat-containing protein [Plasmodiophora brassicae]
MVAVVAVAVNAAGRRPPPDRPARPAADVVIPTPRPRPALTIDDQHWRRAGAGWVHKTRGWTYRGDVVQHGAGVVVPQGRGRVSDPGNATYVGQWQNGRRHGEGEYLATDGSYAYRGRFRHDVPTGYGVSSHANGWRYEGHHVQGERHGHGTWTDTAGQVLDGQWRLNLFHGRGRVLLADGRALDGEFAEWMPRASDGSFRGQVIDARGRVTRRITEWTSKRDLLVARADPRRPGHPE